MYNDNEIPRPMDVLSSLLSSTKAQREKIRDGKEGAGAGAGDAVIHYFKRDLRVRDNTGLSMASATAKKKGNGVGVIGVYLLR